MTDAKTGARVNRRLNLSRPGFALVEAAVVAIVLATALALLLICGGDSRRNARLGQDLANLRHYGTGTAAYASDNADLMWGFSWKTGVTPDADPDLRVASNSLQAAANQAVQILRDRAGRTDIMPITSWIPHIAMSYLVFTDYMGDVLPDHSVVSTGDANVLTWRDDPSGFDAGLYVPRPFATPTAGNADKRYPYWASWRMGVAFFDRGEDPSNCLKWGISQRTYIVPGNANLGAPRLSQIAFPSQKAMMFDEFQRHFGPRQAFYGYDESRVPVLAVDGAVAVRAATDGNIGWDPGSPARAGQHVTFYRFDVPSSSPAQQWYPMPLNGMLTDPNVTDRFMWTRGGILGRDFDGPEIDTGQW